MIRRMNKVESSLNKKQKVVVVGGGTGTFAVLSGLKKYHSELDLSAIVTMADAGGSTGRLRDEFGHLPVGDVRMALAALATDVEAHDQLVRELFLYRFDKGNGLSGHNFGNLLLTALTDILGNEVDAITTASRILRVRGQVIPVTADNVHLQAVYDDGVVVVGEHHIDEPPVERQSHRIVSVSLTPTAQLSLPAKETIESADKIIFGPGDLYTSILPNCVVEGFAEAVQKSQARLFYVSNLMTKAGQTNNMSVANHVDALEAVLGRKIDSVIINQDALPTQLLERYAAEQEFPVVDDMESASQQQVIRAHILAQEETVTKKGDVLRRSLLRHDSAALAQVLMTAWEV